MHMQTSSDPTMVWGQYRGISIGVRPSRKMYGNVGFES